MLNKGLHTGMTEFYLELAEELVVKISKDEQDRSMREGWLN